MKHQSNVTEAVKKQFFHSNLDSQLRRFALSGLAYLLGSDSGLDMEHYKPKDGKLFVDLFSDALDLNRKCRKIGRNFSNSFNMMDPPNWSNSQLLQIERSITAKATWKNFPKRLFTVYLLRFFKFFIIRYLRFINFRLVLKRNDVNLSFEIAEIRKVVAQRVLMDVSFQFLVGRAFHLFLRRRVIMHPEGGETPKLAVATFWTLIYSYADLILKEMDDKEFLLVKEGLSKTVHHYSESIDEWASFWDLYVFHLLNSKGVKLPDSLKMSGELLNSLNEDANSEDSKDIPLKENCQKTAPGYAKFLIASEVNI